MISKQRLLQTFLELVRIDAPAKAERPVADYLKKRLKNYHIREDGAGRAIGGNCGNLVVEIPGDGRRSVLLSAHMDTVKPTMGIKTRVLHGIISTDGKTILGADDRAGIAILLELVEHLRVARVSHPPLELVFTVAEEIGLQGAKQIKPAQLKSRLGYVLDCSLDVGMAVNRCVTHQRMVMDVQGRSAHAGVDPEHGINAISIAAKALSRIRTGKISPNSTLNIGTIAGGHAFNIVPDHARVELEMRSFSDAELAGMTRGVKKAFVQAAREAGGKVVIRAWMDFQRFTVSERAPVAHFFLQGAKNAGLKGLLCAYRGGSDGNVFNKMGISCLVLGLGYKGPHTHQEQIAISNMIGSTRLLAGVLDAVR